MQLLKEETNLDKTKCAYKGLGCSKEDICLKRDEAIIVCPLRGYFMYLDAFTAGS